MKKEKAKDLFEKRLDDEYLTKFKNDTLFVPGQILWWENLNNVWKIKIFNYDEADLTVTFDVNDGNDTPSRLTFTLDNFFIFNKEHLDKLYNAAKEFDSQTSSFEDYKALDMACVYIMHDKSCDENNGYYVGQAKNGSWRMKDHLQNSQNALRNLLELEKSKLKQDEKMQGIQKVEKLMGEGMKYTLRFIPLEGSGYVHNKEKIECALNALEACFIAHFNSFHNGYNHTRGNNGPGQSKITKFED